MKHICFVCGRLIRDNPKSIGKGFYRHEQNCAPLTKKYEEYEQRKKRYTAPEGGAVDGTVINQRGL